MYGGMGTVLNVGLTTATIPGMIRRTGDARFVYVSYCRLIRMYAELVMEKATGIAPEEGLGIVWQLEKIMDAMMEENPRTIRTMTAMMMTIASPGTHVNLQKTQVKS